MSDAHGAADPQGIALIGMAGRFPGASGIDRFWRNLIARTESIRIFSREELEASGVPPRIYSDPAYVAAKGALDEDVALFDPRFFGMSPREAALVDPQHRALLECAWEAFEDAAYDPRQFPGRIGSFAGAGKNTYLLFNLAPREDLAASADVYAILAGNEKDYLASRLAWAFGLEGPSISVQTACSSGLVALHLAVQSLLSFECDMALVGGVAIDVPQFGGYHYREEAMLSRDGRCRPFDAAASGTVFGNGVAAVVLRRLEDAVADRDAIRGVVLGTASNNDGDRKIAFGVPSLEGQTDVAVEALAVGGVDPATVGYVETHGTGTAIGDRIEFEALRAAYGPQPAGSCLLGTLKANIGHLGAAAGLAGLIKAVLALESGLIPPAAGFDHPALGLDFDRSRFSLNTAPAPWPLPGPRRAAVHSTAIGGSNAHVILEEPPPRSAGPEDRSHFLFLLSASSSAGVKQFAERLSKTLGDPPIPSALSAADVEWTLQAGRRPLAFRRAIVARDLAELKLALDRIDATELPQTTSGSPAGASSDLAALGDLWCQGKEIDWRALPGRPPAHRVHLPARPFEWVRCWVEPSAIPAEPSAAAELDEREETTPRQVDAGLAALFEENLGLGPLRQDDDFFQLGATSMDILSLTAAIEETFNLRLPSGAILRHPTLAGMAEVIERLLAAPHQDPDDGALDDGVDLSADWALDGDIRPSGRAARPAVSSVLLTGATGFLGAHVLHELLALRPELSVLCPVRAASVEEGRERIRTRFRELGLPDGAADARVVPVPADLSRQRFGLTPPEFTVLAHAVDSIIHCASRVSFVAAYPALKRTNVDGVREVLRLAMEGPEKTVHHVSSIAVFEADSLHGVERVAEDMPLDRCHGFHNGYDLSKWVAERMIGEARQRGVAASVFRPSNIAGDSRSGVVLPEHILSRFLKGCLQLGAAPGDVTINLVCVDAVARAIASRALLPAAGGLAFHLVNPTATPMSDLIRWTRSRGHALEPVPYAEWAARMIDSPRDNAFRPFLPLLEQGPLFSGRAYARENTDAVIGAEGKFDPFDEALLGKHLDHLTRIGFL
ncbi:MAG TPA: thioester reductase domain-containing protein [Thermoanaerobaculia bacterium]|jgi:thioester reductase-like protein|nr:thioester reductase domain-containing protein [Thermoanaerobaculia bacterium]